MLWTGAPWSELSLIDDIVPGSALRDGLIKRLTYAQTKVHEFPKRRNGVYPV